MSLDDLYIPVGAEQPSCIAHEIRKHGDAERSIGRAKDGDLPCGFRNLPICVCAEPVVPMRIGTPVETARSRLAASASGAEKIDQHVAMILVNSEAGLSSTAAAIALPIRPSGAIRLIRIGWSAVLMPNA